MSSCLRVCPVVGHAVVCVCVCVCVCGRVLYRPLYIDTTTTYMHCYHLRTPYTPFTPTHGCCGSRRMLYPAAIRERSVLYAYRIRTVSGFSSRPAAQFWKWFNFSRMLRTLRTKSVENGSYSVRPAPAGIRTLSTASVLSPPTKLTSTSTM